MSEVIHDNMPSFHRAQWAAQEGNPTFSRVMYANRDAKGLPAKCQHDYDDHARVEPTRPAATPPPALTTPHKIDAVRRLLKSRPSTPMCVQYSYAKARLAEQLGPREARDAWCVLEAFEAEGQSCASALAHAQASAQGEADWRPYARPCGDALLPYVFGAVAVVLAAPFAEVAWRNIDTILLFAFALVGLAATGFALLALFCGLNWLYLQWRAFFGDTLEGRRRRRACWWYSKAQWGLEVWLSGLDESHAAYHLLGVCRSLAGLGRVLAWRAGQAGYYAGVGLWRLAQWPLFGLALVGVFFGGLALFCLAVPYAACRAAFRGLKGARLFRRREQPPAGGEAAVPRGTAESAGPKRPDLRRIIERLTEADLDDLAELLKGRARQEGGRWGYDQLSAAAAN